MREFFKGWRRKAGCVTLVMALAVMGMWLRSHRSVDSIELNSPFSNCIFVSGGSRFLFVFGKQSINQMGLSGQDVRLGVMHVQGDTRNRISIEWDSYPANTVHVWPGLGPVSELGLAPDERTMLHYFVAVLPLALLSAYLLLWQPRKRTGQDNA